MTFDLLHNFMLTKALLPSMLYWLLTSEYWCEQSGDDTASIDGEVEEREKPPQEIFLQSKGQCVLGTIQFRVYGKFAAHVH